MRKPTYNPADTGRTTATVCAIFCALSALLLAASALFLDNAALRLLAVMICSALLVLAITAGLRRRVRRLTAESDAAHRDCHVAREREVLFRHKSELDPLTGTLNRAAFFEHAQAHLSDAGDTHAFLMLDLDGFKQVNDTCGHGEGDRTLIAVAESIRGVLRAQDLLCRIGGDEFAILLLSVADDAVIARRAHDICAAVRRTVCGRVPLSASIGASVFPRDGAAAADLYAKADSGLYLRKHLGKDGFSFFRPPDKPLTDGENCDTLRQ